MHTRFQTVLLSTLLFCSLPLFAQTAPPPDDGDTDEPDVEIVVTAGRIEEPISETIAATTVITAKEIRDAGAQTVGDVLRLVPGVSIRQFGNPGAQISSSLRGTSPNQVLVLVDGQRMTSPAFFDGTDLSKFPVTDIERIEVVRGPVSSLYGSDAFGGVINIITKHPEQMGGELISGFGSHKRANRMLSLHDANKLFDWRFSASVPGYGGFRPNSDYFAKQYTGRIDIPQIAGWKLSVSGEHYTDTLGLPNVDPNHTGMADPDDRQWWRRSNLHITAGHTVAEGEFSIQGYRIIQQLRNTAPGLDWMNNPVVYNSLITGGTNGLEATYRRDFGAHQWIFGGEYREEDYTDIETGAAPSTQAQSLNNKAFFAQDRWGLNDHTELVLGGRYDNHSTAGGKLTPRIGLNRALGEKSHLRLSFADGFRAPNFVELYYPAGSWGPGYSGNPDLKPETSRQYEIGYRYDGTRDVLDLSAFNFNVMNLIQATSATPYENVGKARQRGIEMSWEHRFSKLMALSLSYTYLDAKNRTTGERLMGIPHHLISLTASRKFGVWDVALSGRWNSERPDWLFDPVTYASTPVMLPARAVFDLTLTRTQGLLNPYLTIRNLTNTSYEEVAGYPTEGRGLEVGMRGAW